MKLRITIEGVSYDVDVEVLDDGNGAPGTQAPSARPAPARFASTNNDGAATASAPAPAAPHAGGSSDKICKSPIAGTVLDVKVKPGDRVALNQVLLVMEAMKMETNVASPVAGTVRAVHVSQGHPVKQGQLLVEFE